MKISVSVVLVLGVIVAVLLKGGSLRMSGVAAAGLFGFYLASTEAAPSVNELMATLSSALTDIG